MAFSDGLRFGADMVQAGLNDARLSRAEARQAELDRRAAEEHTLRMNGLRRADARAGRVDQATQNYEALLQRGGLDDATTQDVGRVYGMTPQQVTAAGSGLQGRLASMDVPDNLDLQNAPAPAGVNVGLSRRRAMLGARQGIDAARGDTAAMAAREAEGRGLDIEEGMAKVRGQLQDPEFRDRLARQVNLRNNFLQIDDAPTDPRTGRPTGPPVIRVIEADGKTKQVSLNEAQYERLAYASVLAQNGAQAEAMQLIGTVNADVAGAVQRNNELMRQTATANNQAAGTFQQGESAYMGRLEQARHNQATERQRAAEAAATASYRAASLSRQAPGRPPGPEYKLSDIGGNLVYTDRNGEVVGRFDPQLGRVPLAPNPFEDPRVKAQADRFGIAVAPANLDGRTIWAYVSPNGDPWTTLEEAMASTQASAAARTRTAPRNEMARRAPPATPPSVGWGVEEQMMLPGP